MPNFSEQNKKDLKTLGLSLIDLEGLSSEDQLKKIKKQWHLLSIKHHPDKNPDDQVRANTRIRNLNEAYASLEKEFNATNPQRTLDFSIETYLQKKNIPLPLTAFDFIMQENIERAFETLQKRYAALQSEDEQREFVNHYADFLNLARVLLDEKTQKLINQKRIAQLFALEQRNLKKYFYDQWCLFQIQLLGEEYLSDFHYRHALAYDNTENIWQHIQHHLWPILATRKLLSPIKLFVSVVVSLGMLICLPLVYYNEWFFGSLWKNFLIWWDNINQGTMDNQHLLIVLAQIGALMFFIKVVIPIFPLLSIGLIACCLSLPAIKLISCPVNTLLRHLAAYLNISTPLMAFLVTSLLLASGIGFYILAMGALYTNLIIALNYFTALALPFYSIYLSLKFSYNLYTIKPVFGIVNCLLTILNLSSQINFSIVLMTTAASLSLSTTVFFLYFSLLLCFFLYFANQKIENIKQTLSQQLDYLALPEEDIPKETQQAMFQGCLIASQSHRFFATGKEAEIQPKPNLSQQIYRFFGGEANSAREPWQPTKALPPPITLEGKKEEPKDDGIGLGL